MKNKMRKLLALILAIGLVCTMSACSSAGGGETTEPSQEETTAPVVDEPKMYEYVFEAECTDLRGKSGPGASGEASGTSMASTSADPEVSGDYHGFVTYLYQKGVSVNFVIKSDRDVENVKLVIRLGIESMDYYFNPSNYTIQIDSCSEDDLKDINDGGAVGNWDAFFMDYYGPDGDGKDDETHVRYTLDKWDCGEIHLDGTGSNSPINFTDFTITTTLSLKEGYTCISLITNNSSIPVNNKGVEMAGTYGAVAPCIDCIKLTTDAVLEMAVTYNNGCGTTAMTASEVE